MKVIEYYTEIFTQEDPYISNAFKLGFFRYLSNLQTGINDEVDDYRGLYKTTPWYENLKECIFLNEVQGLIDYDTLPIDWMCSKSS